MSFLFIVHKGFEPGNLVVQVGDGQCVRLIAIEHLLPFQLELGDSRFDRFSRGISNTDFVETGLFRQFGQTTFHRILLLEKHGFFVAVAIDLSFCVAQSLKQETPLFRDVGEVPLFENDLLGLVDLIELTLQLDDLLVEEGLDVLAPAYGNVRFHVLPNQ